MNTSIRGTVLLVAVAALAGCHNTKNDSTTPSGATASAVKCQGINSCKGMGECNGKDHPCGKHTPCKGHGWLTVPSADECTARGGTVL